MHPHCLLALFALFLAAVAVSAAPDEDYEFGPETGGYQPILNPATDPDVKEMVEYAVSEINFQSLKNLVFKSLVRAELQMVEGLNYHLVISVMDPDHPNIIQEYDITVFTRYWDKIQVLKSWRSCPYRC